MGDLAERVWNVADVHCFAEHRSHSMAAQKVADKRLATWQELVGNDVPGADEQLSLLYQPLDVIESFGPDLEVVLERDRVPVEHEMLVFALGVEQIDQLIEQSYEP